MRLQSQMIRHVHVEILYYEINEKVIKIDFRDKENRFQIPFLSPIYDGLSFHFQWQIDAFSARRLISSQIAFSRFDSK